MNGAEHIEHACADAWQALIERRLGEWRLRAAADRVGTERVPFTARANSALAVGDPGIAITSALDEVCEFAHEQRIEPVVQVVHGDPVESELLRSGWRPYHEHAVGCEVSVLVGPTGQGGEAGDERIRMLDAPTAGWWELTVDSPLPTTAQRHVLTSGDRVGFGVAEHQAGTVAAVRGAVVGDLLHVARLAVRQRLRRRGIAGGLMRRVSAWGSEHGTTRCVLQVAVGNNGALALYQRLGFREHHRYRYWVPGTPWQDRAP
ncbi:ribosomal protein S18 acetylase RimI-like enzyme [Saccharomonospora amisosensis]|uniref:Ribosomal protein S18 acetylase RimI-like enzyme n=1 Tax=Saccharomonospora amisosensis TaxID=1128677 RepID=A0A7X5ZT34_9PSEU|nr:GNAT family N-acetyltransferase [Saccharomonospora amisosensis]NIJ13990.1 ribosomal protein S18 acetylase RimI-like enzyme [Saccharomonospora amisosensis]